MKIDSKVEKVVKNFGEDKFRTERVDLAAAFQWTAKLNMHEGVANHFSLAVSEDGNRFLINPNQRHFSRIKASDLLLLDADDKEVLDQAEAPDPTAWGLHSPLHRICPHARCAMHVHSTYSTVLACLKDKSLPPIDQNTAMFFNRVVIDEDYGGLAFESEGERCAKLFANSKGQVMIMGNHGILVVGKTVAETFDRLFYFERAVKTYILALQTGRELTFIPDHIAEGVATSMEEYPHGSSHFEEIKRILDFEKSDFRL